MDAHLPPLVLWKKVSEMSMIYTFSPLLPLLPPSVRVCLATSSLEIEQLALHPGQHQFGRIAGVCSSAMPLVEEYTTSSH